MFPMSYEYALFVRLKLKMRTIFCGDVVLILIYLSDLFKHTYGLIAQYGLS